MVCGLFPFCDDVGFWQMSNCSKYADGEVSEGSVRWCGTDSDANGVCRSFVHKHHSFCAFRTVLVLMLNFLFYLHTSSIDSDSREASIWMGME